MERFMDMLTKIPHGQRALLYPTPKLVLPPRPVSGCGQRPHAMGATTDQAKDRQFHTEQPHLKRRPRVPHFPSRLRRNTSHMARCWYIKCKSLTSRLKNFESQAASDWFQRDRCNLCQ